MDQGLYYLRRAEKFPGFTEEQRQTLQKLMTVTYYQARRKLENARRLVSGALIRVEARCGKRVPPPCRSRSGRWNEPIKLLYCWPFRLDSRHLIHRVAETLTECRAGGA